MEHGPDAKKRESTEQKKGKSLKVARLQSEFCTKEIFLSYEFSYEKCPEISPEIFEPLF